MSGIEVAGLILGLYPLVVSALEQYRHVYKAAGLLTRFESEYRKTLDDVKDEQLFFRMTLEELLLPLSTNESFDEGDLEGLLSDPTVSGWNNEDIQFALQERLGRAYERFVGIMTLLHSLMSRLLVTLISDKPELQSRIKERTRDESAELGSKVNKLSAVALQNLLKKQWHYRKEQIQFGLGATGREYILKEIRKYNKKLDILLAKSEKIATFRKPHTLISSPRAVRSLLQYWQHADRIYTFIHHSWGCLCKEQHCAHLWLQHRTSPVFEFKLLLLWAPKVLRAQNLPPWDRQGLSITSKTLTGQINSSQTVLRPDHESWKTSTSVSVCSDKTKKRRVGFTGLLMGPSSSSSSLNTEPVVPATRADVNQQAEPENQWSTEISRLCDTMSASGMQDTWIGSFNDHEAGRQYSVFSKPEQKIAGDEITLQEVLHGPRKYRLKRSDRFRIALAVASSHLQLHSTRWARKQWEAPDIRFPLHTDKDASIMFDKPYVSADFNATLRDEERAPKKTDRSFACLGVILLELLFGKSLEDHELWEKLGPENKATTIFRLMVAKQWADEVEGEGGPDFSAAVMWCLTESPTTLEGEQWRRDLADRVVIPIQNCCECFASIWVREL